MAANWPKHKRKAALKKANRRRVIADLAREQLKKEKAYGIRI